MFTLIVVFVRVLINILCIAHFGTTGTTNFDCTFIELHCSLVHPALYWDRTRWSKGRPSIVLSRIVWSSQDTFSFFLVRFWVCPQPTCHRLKLHEACSSLFVAYSTTTGTKHYLFIFQLAPVQKIN
ncbi:hypothetical protein QL285_052907 [Trifolium repens]|nr:hypothetical protein QL285_052907 [Trifolium repens]